MQFSNAHNVPDVIMKIIATDFIFLMGDRSNHINLLLRKSVKMFR